MLAYKLHVTAVVLSISGFIFRGMLHFSGSPMIRQKWIRIAPHVIDTILLASAITLAYLMRFNPMLHPWLAMKITCLLIYIGLGMYAFRFGKSRSQRMLAWVAAIGVYTYIVGLALTKQVSLGL